MFVYVPVSMHSIEIFFKDFVVTLNAIYKLIYDYVRIDTLNAYDWRLKSVCENNKIENRHNRNDENKQAIE